MTSVLPNGSSAPGNANLLRNTETELVRDPAGKFVVYDPPADGLPYVAVLFKPRMRPRAFLFQSLEEAKAFMTSQAIARY